ncbi:hypothetical protein [Lignipirellula cremea]|uniref:Tetratricopeptide repeat protein n=1 Tax=Lignipirellula cremea TaxID=2528010 RepID=A0A518DV32_9BACT|nr:hypothetical protein [Lignipirellula cremea]QDU95689.1 hypothetical protein Pla8534_35060 [Lignipirellula cremea]
MTNDSYDQAARLLQEARALPNGDVQLRMTEEAVRLVDRSGDPDFQFYARLKLVEAATFSGKREKSLAAFAWCLSAFQAEPTRYDHYEHDLLWGFKYMLSEAIELPQISRAEFEQLAAQMVELYRRGGYNLRPVHSLQMQFAVSTGEYEIARAELQRYRRMERDPLADCAACEDSNDTEVAGLAGDFKKMLALSEPALAGRVSCATVPHDTCADCLWPLAMLGRYEEADANQRRGYRLIRNNSSFLRSTGRHMAYLVHRNRQRAALGILERHLSWALDTFQLWSQYHFFVAARSLMRLVGEKKTQIKLNLPAPFPLYQKSGEYETAVLVQWFEEKVNTVGERFNQRNGNQFATTEFLQQLEY